jgi:HlyD family secretion protein
MKKLIVFLALLWGGGAAGLWYWNDHQAQSVEFRSVVLARGDILPTINATGTIEPEEVVDVGAQVAGIIQQFGPDPEDPDQPIGYGSRVEEGTILVQLDDALYKARVEQARANLDRSQAEVEQARAKLRMTERDLERLNRLRERSAGLVSPQEMDAAQSAFEQAQAALLTAESAVEVAQANVLEAQVNLGYTTIRSPVRGVILDRRVNIGQTVVASLNAPSLFLIAKDLRRMQIWASVNETDIGSIHQGQPVTFTVGAYPGETFRGTVTQIRLNASMVQNVVTYTVVVEFDNPDGKLLPYLTARLRFEQEGRQGVLLVPNSALRWQPRAPLIAPDFRDQVVEARNREAREPDTVAASQTGTLWVRDGDFLRPISLTLGLSDGIRTEVFGPDLYEGMEVVVGANQRDAPTSAFSILPHMRKGSAKESPRP